MGACCSCQLVQLQPGKVHIKKLKDIFAAYLKNQGIKESKKNAGKNIIDQEVSENVERHAKSSAKDLVQLMQIDQQFIKKIAAVLTKRILDYEQSTELQYLGLVLLREVMSIPITDEKDKLHGPIGKGEGVQTEDRVANVRRNWQKGIKKVQNTLKFHKNLGNSPSGASAVSVAPSQAHSVFPDQQQHHPSGGKKQSSKANKKRTTGAKGTQDDKQLEYKVEELHSKQFVFCTINERLILDTISELMTYYNYEINNDQHANLMLSATALSPPQQERSPRKQIIAGQQQITEILQSKQNRQRFSETCLDILRILLENLTKSQIVENQISYFDLLTNYLFKVPQQSKNISKSLLNNLSPSKQVSGLVTNDSGAQGGNLNIGAMQANAGFFQLFGLNKQHPIANGLELTIINPLDQVLGFTGEPGGDKTGEKIPIQFNFNYLHNTSFQHSEGNQDGNNHPNRRKSHKNTGRYQNQNNNNQPPGPICSEQVTDLTFQVRLKAYSSFFQLLKIMKEGYFIKEFPQILEYVWCLLELTQNKIENLDSNKSMKNTPQKNISSELENISDDTEQFESLLQLGFNIFQYLCVRVSNNQDSNQIFVGVQDSPDELLQLLQNGIFQYFNKVNQWSASKFAEFVFVLMIFNGGKRRLQGKNFDFADFFVLLQAYYDKKTKAINGFEIGSLKELYMDGQRVQAMDEKMFEVIFESLFRLLVVDIFEITNESYEVIPVLVTQQVIKNKLNLIKVLFELLNLIDAAPPKASNQQDGNFVQAVPGLQNDQPADSNILYQRLIQNQTNFTQIFLDLITFIAHQSEGTKTNSHKIIIDQGSQEDINSSMESENQLKPDSQNCIADFQVQLQQLFELYLFKINTEHEVLIKSLDHCICRLHALNYKLHYVRSIDDEKQEQIIIKEIDLLLDAINAHMYFLQESLNNNFTQCLIDLQILNSNGQIISQALQNNTPFTFVAQGNSTIVQNQSIQGQPIQNLQLSPTSKRKSQLDKGLRISDLNQKLKGNSQFVGNLLLNTGQSLVSPHITNGSAAPRSSQLSQATLAQAGNFGINQLQAINFLNLNIGQNQQVGDYYNPLFQPLNPDNLIFLSQICESFCSNKINKKGQLIKKVQGLCNQLITFNQLVFQIQQKLNLEISSPFLNLVTQEEESPLDPPACCLQNHNLQDLLLCLHHSHQEIYSHQFQPNSQNQTANIQAKPLIAYRQKLFNEGIKQYKNQRKIKTPSNQVSSQQNFTEENLLKPINLLEHDIPLKISDLESPNKDLIQKTWPQHFCILNRKESIDVLQQEEQNKNYKWIFSRMEGDQILQILLQASVISEDDQILQQQLSQQEIIFAENNNLEVNNILASLHSAKENPDAFQFQQLRMLTKGIFTRHNLRSQYKIFINYFANSQEENEDKIQNKFMKKIQKPMISSMILFMDNFLLTSKYNLNLFFESITSSLQIEESSKAVSIAGTDYWPQKSNNGSKQSFSHEILKQLFDKFKYEKSIVYHIAFIFSLFEKVNEIQIVDQANLKINNSAFKSPPQTTLHFDNADGQKAKKSPRKYLEQLIKTKTLLIFIFIGYLNQMCPQKQNQDLSNKFFRGYYSLIKEINEIFAKVKLSQGLTFKSLEEFLPCLPQFPLNPRNSKKSDFQDVIPLNRTDSSSSINDKNRSIEAMSQSKDQESDKFYLCTESIEITLTKFERIFSTVELHLIDSLIATDLFQAIINKLPTLQQAAQNDLALFFDFLNNSQSQNQIDSSSVQIYFGDSNDGLIKRDMQQAKQNQGQQQLGNLRSPNLTFQLNLQQAKKLIVDEQVFEKQNGPYFNLLYLNQPEKMQVSGINDFEGFMSKQSVNFDKTQHNKGGNKKLISSIYQKQNANVLSPNPMFGPVIDLSKKFSNNFYGQKQDSDRISFFNKNNRRLSHKQKIISLDNEPSKKAHLQSQNSQSNFDSFHDIHDISVSLQRDYDIPIGDDPVFQNKISIQKSSNKKKTDRIYSFKEPEENCSLHQIQLKSCSSLSSYDADQNQTQFE